MTLKPKIPSDTNELSLFLTSTISSFLQPLLLNPSLRRAHKESCSERLAAASSPPIPFPEQAVLANLDWGIDSLDEALASPSPSPLLVHADRMLQICASLDPLSSTASIPNSYLRAWSHLHLSLLSLVRNDPLSATLHALHMFEVEPFFARTDFAPLIWEAVFGPHMAGIVAWYAESRHDVVLEGEEGEMGEGRERLRGLEREYGEALDRSTRMYARYYEEVVRAGGGGRKGGPGMVPIAEPPRTPRREVSWVVPEVVRMGPVVPRSRGFGLGGRGER